jgi:hypothetical protein
MTTPSPRWLRLATHAPRLAWQLARSGVPKRALLFGPRSLGDDLLCTAVLREARERGEPWTMLTARPELFSGNSDPARLLPIDDYYVQTITRLGSRVVQPYYVRPDPTNADRDVLPPRHIIAEMCRLAGLHGTVKLRPWLTLSSAEKAGGSLFPRQIALQSTGLSAAIPYVNKEWGPENFVAVAQRLSPEFKLVQLGTTQDPPLPVDADLRGKTTLREAAAVLASSLVFVGLEGFLAHLARSVDTPAAIVLGGRAKPASFGYIANRNFSTPTPCSPCGLRNTCGFNHECLTRIQPGEVAEAARQLAARPAGPLPVETAELP